MEIVKSASMLDNNICMVNIFSFDVINYKKCFNYEIIFLKNCFEGKKVNILKCYPRMNYNT